MNKYPSRGKPGTGIFGSAVLLIYLLWERWAEEHEVIERKKFALDNAVDFFGFNYSIKDLLEKAEIVDGHRGIGGYSLTIAPEQLTLLQIYQAVTEDALLPWQSSG